MKLSRSLVLLLAAPSALGVHHFKDLNSLSDLEQLGVIDPSPEGKMSDSFKLVISRRLSDTTSTATAVQASWRGVP